jgi:exonuclease III
LRRNGKADRGLQRTEDRIDPKGAKGQSKSPNKGKEREGGEEMCLEVEREEEEGSSKSENIASTRFEEKYGRLRIAMHNINGLKNNQHRLQDLIDYGESLDLDMIGIVETNIKEREARYINIASNKYSCWWSSAEQGKHKGSGVGILVSKNWSEHLTEIRRPNAYSVRATFSFRRTKLIVWVVYMPPSDKRMQKEIQRMVTKDISGKKGETQYIIGGDFNKILDQNLDTTNTKKKSRNSQLPLIKWIQTLGYREVFRSMNPDLRKYTWSNGTVKTRIDQIWVSTRIKEGLQKSDIEEMDLVTGSDHNLIWGEMRTFSFLDYSIPNRSKANIEKIPVRRIYLYEEASEENWENYKNSVDNLLKENNKAYETEKADALRNLTRKEAFINNEWDRILNAINRAAAKHIPSKLSKRTREEKNKQAPRNPKYQDVKTLKRIAKRIRDRHHNSEDEIDIFLWNCQIQEINMRHEVQVQEIDLLSNEEWIQNTRGWIRTLENKIHKEEQIRSEKVIIENIERRYGLIGKKDKQMLNSILEHPWRSLLIEKVLIEDKITVCNSELVTNPELVKEQIDIHFQKQFSKRKHKFEGLTEEWEDEYSPKRWIQRDWYEEVMAEVTEEEWRESLSAAKANTAPGISGISYTLIRRVGPTATKALLFLVNTILEVQIFPRKWKIGQIFPIPKMAEWDLMLGSTRPIMLLETCRKTLVRIIQKRLSKVLVEHKILKGMNFAGLPGESTYSPIHTINNLLEDAKQKNKETWVLLQDIKKAFDSVSMKSIELALIRIKVPENLIRFIIEIFNGRQAQVITKYGLTKGFQAEDGIDQGEVISPLIWRIIYDPLLTKLQDMRKGYTLSVNWPVHIEKRKERKLSCQVAAVAYADDTTFIADSKNSLQQIINKAQEFYNLNDIEINPKKSELLVLNREKGKTYSITLGGKKEEIKAKKVEDTVRLLGVWIGGKNQKRMCRSKLQQEVRAFTQLIRAKRISIEQIKYLNNMVLLPRLEYRSMIFLWTKRACDKIHQPMLRLAKWKAGLASTCSNALLTHKDLLGFRSFWQRHTESMITEWMVRLNDSEVLGQTCLLRLREAQLEACDPDSIWDTNSISFENKAIQNNLNMEILFAAKSLKITVQTDYLEEN